MSRSCGESMPSLNGSIPSRRGRPAPYPSISRRPQNGPGAARRGPTNCLRVLQQHDAILVGLQPLRSSPRSAGEGTRNSAGGAFMIVERLEGTACVARLRAVQLEVGGGRRLQHHPDGQDAADAASASAGRARPRSSPRRDEQDQQATGHDADALDGEQAPRAERTPGPARTARRHRRPPTRARARGPHRGPHPAS